MKRSLKSLLMCTLMLAGGLVIAGCESDHSARAHAGDKAVMCDKCKTVWVSHPGTEGRYVNYKPDGAMTCPDCKTAVENYFANGTLAHSCSTCGGNLAACDMH